MSSHSSSPPQWSSLQRGYDYYRESDLIWLEADTKIRELSHGEKSLDDFAKLFLGVNNGSYVTDTYTLDDLVQALNKVQPYDWAGFFQTRVYEVAPSVPENGILQGGYRLVYNDVEPEWMKHMDTSRGTSFGQSLGLTVKGRSAAGSDEGSGTGDGTITQVWWDSPAFKAGIAPGMQLVGVDDQAFSIATLRDAILKAESSNTPIRLLMKREKELVTVSIDYHGGMRYAHLERVESKPDLLDEVLAPVK